MEFKDAFEMVYDIHNECGDRDGWDNHRYRLKDDVLVYKSYEEWKDRLSSRTDISDDERWDFECFKGSVAVLFSLMKVNK